MSKKKWFNKEKNNVKRGILASPFGKESATWDSGLNVISELKIKIPQKILQVCRSIQDQLPHTEFSILCKGSWNGEFTLSEDYIVPKQRVQGASVDYTEDLTPYKQQGYNVVIHSHPWGGTEFSSSDDETINTNFSASILFGGKDFTKAVITVAVSENTKIQIEAKILVSIEDIEQVDISNIEKETYISPMGSTYGYNVYGGYGFGLDGNSANRPKLSIDEEIQKNFNGR